MPSGARTDGWRRCTDERLSPQAARPRQILLGLLVGLAILLIMLALVAVVTEGLSGRALWSRLIEPAVLLLLVPALRAQQRSSRRRWERLRRLLDEAE